MKYVLVALSLVALSVSACKKSEPAAPAATEAAAPAAEAPPKPVPAELPAVLAKVNGEDIKKTDFDMALESIQQRAGQPVPDDQRDRIYRGLLDELIGMKLLQQEAAARKIEVTEAELTQNIDTLKQHMGGDAGFTQALAAQKLSLEAFKEQTRKEIRVGKMLEAEVGSKVSVEAKELQDFYDKNPDQFKEPERLKASHILITVAEGADAKTKDAARAKAAGVLKQVRGGGDFAALAKKHSQDPGNAANGGEIGYFTRGQMVPPFEKAVWALQPGEISDVVETQFGFHVIKLAERLPERTVTLDEVKPQLEQFLTDRQRQEKTTAFVNALKSKGKVEILI